MNTHINKNKRKKTKAPFKTEYIEVKGKNGSIRYKAVIVKNV